MEKSLTILFFASFSNIILVLVLTELFHRSKSFSFENFTLFSTAVRWYFNLLFLILFLFLLLEFYCFSHC